MVNRFIFPSLIGCFFVGGALWQLQAAPRQFVPIATAKTANQNAPIVGTFASEVSPVTEKFCVRCHGGDKQIAGVNLQNTKTHADVLKQRALWHLVLKQMQNKQMPPEGLPAPTQAQRDRMTKWLTAVLKLTSSTRSTANDSAHGDNAPVLSCGILVPGRVTLRRLNREEYNNTIADLTGVSLRPADDFPSDDVGYGFDNIGDVLSISPLLMEKYLDAAEAISQAAITVPHYVKKRWSGAAFIGENAGDNVYNFYSSDEASIEYSIPADGIYTVRVSGWENHAGDDNSRLELLVDGKSQSTLEVSASQNAPQTIERKLELKAGRCRISLAFINDFYKPELPEGQRDRNAYVEWMEIEGPQNDAQKTLPSSHKQIIFVSPNEIKANEDAAARKVVSRLARRAYRRPASPEDVERLMSAYRAGRQNGGSFEEGVQIALQATLVSPRFLFRLETDNRTGERALNSWELASRLSYFLWSSMPDEELMKLASQDKLREDRVLEAQVVRMTKSPKARALADNFAAQWFTLRNLQNVAPDPTVNPDWNEDLRRDMKQETLLFFNDIVQNDRSVLEFLDGKWSYLNANLARHYGLPGEYSNSFKRVVFDERTAKQRSGVLTQASVLTVTSNPTRTSPVKRGKWVMENFWGTSPPPPPPGVPELRENAALRKTVTVRARLEEHRRNPECASCHKMMDPIGFGLENYDATGKWREADGALKIDTSGSLQSGEKFNGAVEFKTILVKRRAQFVTALSEKMLTYALGRGLKPSDDCYIRDVSAATVKNSYKFSSLILGVVQSKAFQMQGANETVPAKAITPKTVQKAAPKTKIKAATSSTRS